MTFITITNRKGSATTLVNLDNVRAIVEEDDHALFVMIPSGEYAYNIKTEESFREVTALVHLANQGTRVAFCLRHGGTWGDDATCEDCTTADGEPRPVVS